MIKKYLKNSSYLRCINIRISSYLINDALLGWCQENPDVHNL